MYDNPKKAKVIVGQVFFKKFSSFHNIIVNLICIFITKKIIIDFNKLLTK